MMRTRVDVGAPALARNEAETCILGERELHDKSASFNSPLFYVTILVSFLSFFFLLFSFSILSYINALASLVSSPTRAFSFSVLRRLHLGPQIRDQLALFRLWDIQQLVYKLNSSDGLKALVVLQINFFNSNNGDTNKNGHRSTSASMKEIRIIYLRGIIMVGLLSFFPLLLFCYILVHFLFFFSFLHLVSVLSNVELFFHVLSSFVRLRLLRALT
ncbi:hypothetical protein DFH11DRAFT_1600045 [Phellopilus nigrolimitatus]|nr:hypothetical protein DFH11DRAFT_1600045 [Phellopilus nigrolimitatus]